jgi:hypothetical protein
MARYKNVVSGARVEVRDDKVMDSSWVADDGKAEAKVPAKKTAERKTAAKKSD